MVQYTFALLFRRAFSFLLIQKGKEKKISQLFKYIFRSLGSPSLANALCLSCLSAAAVVYRLFKSNAENRIVFRTTVYICGGYVLFGRRKNFTNVRGKCAKKTCRSVFAWLSWTSDGDHLRRICQCQLFVARFLYTSLPPSSGTWHVCSCFLNLRK